MSFNQANSALSIRFDLGPGRTRQLCRNLYEK